MESESRFDDNNILNDSDTILSVGDVEGIFSIDSIKTQQLYVSYIRNAKRYARLCTNAEHELGHIDILLTRGSIAALLPGIDLQLNESELYARVRMRRKCPISRALVIPVGHVITKLIVDKFGIIIASNVRCHINGRATKTMNASVFPYDPRAQKKNTIYTITISLTEEDDLAVEEGTVDVSLDYAGLFEKDM